MTVLDGTQYEADGRKTYDRRMLGEKDRCRWLTLSEERSLRHKSRGAEAQTEMISSGSAAVAFFKPITSSRLGFAVQAAIRMTQW
mmetsp:Transcript_31789/g.72559  ORF Transcript_31789/g.72559 Transcript_31789/m.72559 type:complete len:85 (-) Transcript_31789:144-398(-)